MNCGFSSAPSYVLPKNCVFAPKGCSLLSMEPLREWFCKGADMTHFSLEGVKFAAATVGVIQRGGALAIIKRDLIIHLQRISKATALHTSTAGWGEALDAVGSMTLLMPTGGFTPKPTAEGLKAIVATHKAASSSSTQDADAVLWKSIPHPRIADASGQQVTTPKTLLECCKCAKEYNQEHELADDFGASVGVSLQRTLEHSVALMKEFEGLCGAAEDKDWGN